MKNNFMHRCFTIFLLSLLMISCQKTGEEKSSKIFIDDLHHSVRIPQPVHRILSLAPNITEIIYSIGADSMLVGVTDYCDYPLQARTKQKVGGMTNPDIEQIVALHPDCVFMSVEGNIQTDYEKLEKVGIPVFTFNPRKIDDVLASIRSIGEIIGLKRNADSLNSRLQQKVDSIIATVASSPRILKVFIFVALKPLMVVGKNSFVNELIEKAGGANAGTLGIGSYPIMSREQILDSQPDCLIFMSDIGMDKAGLLRQFPEWKNLKAVQDDKIFTVDASILSRPGPRIVDGLECLTRLMHQ